MSTVLVPGTVVKTIKADESKRREWNPHAWNARKWGVLAAVLRHRDFHGSCYDLRHADGTEGTYNPNEIEEVTETDEAVREIVVVPSGNYFRAQIRGEEDYYVSGNSPETAISSLILCHPEKFRLIINMTQVTAASD